MQLCQKKIFLHYYEINKINWKNFLEVLTNTKTQIQALVVWESRQDYRGRPERNII